VTGTEAVLYQRRANAWNPLHLSALAVDGAVTANGVSLPTGGLTVTNGQINGTFNTTNRVWTAAPVIVQGANATGGGRVCYISAASPGFQIGAFGATTPYLLDHNGTTMGTLNYTAPSSARFKRDIADVAAGVLERIRGLRVRQFRRLGAHATVDDDGVEVVPEQPPGRLEVGLVLEEAEQAMPELRIDDPVAAVDVGPLLDSPGLVYWLVAAVQELADQVDALAAAR
jgi:hypothetical protein